MRFVKLVVEAFQGVGRAEIEFGPGLNVLYGDNDLGKSTLASAVRAALLVLPKSSEADSYVSWYADAPPRVKLTFCDDDNFFWEVSKVFSQSPSAELRHSKDGVHFKLDCKSREVDEKLRALLQWGIPSPGGKGAPRGLPVSFLAHTLLASQTDVDGILQQSLEKDADASGKLRLQRALATLAQDPLFKRVLDTAQRECDSYFTETGRRRRTQGSKLMAADEAVKKYQREVDALKAQWEESLGIEEHVRARRATREECMERVSDAQAALALAQAGLANTNARGAVSQQLLAARQALAGMEADAASVEALRRDVDEQAKTLAGLAAHVAKAEREVGEAEAGLRSAEEDAQRALQDQGEQARQLRRAELEGELAKLGERRTQLESRRELARRALEASRALAQANDALVQAQNEKTRTASELKSARDVLQRAESEVDLARAVLAFTRWRTTAAQVTAAEESRRNAAEQRALAEAKASEAAVIEARGAQELAAVQERKSTLPTAEQLEFLERSRRALDLAEAALGGGLSVLVRARRPLTLQAELDQQPAEPVQLAGDRAFEAVRSARLSIDALLDIEVTAGGAEQRRAVERARETWRDECAPLLGKAAASSLQELKGAVAAAARAEQVAREALANAEKLRVEAQTLRGRADLLDQQAERTLPDPSELSARRAAIGSESLEALEDRWAKLGKPNEVRAEAEHARQLEARRDVTQRVTRLEQASLLTEHVVTTAEQRVQQASQHADGAQMAFGDEKPETLSRAIELELKLAGERATSVESELAALDAEHSDQRTRAQKAVEIAHAALDLKKAARLAAQQVADAARETLNKKQGELSLREQQIARLDRAAAAGQVASVEAALAALPSAPLATPADVEKAAAELARAEKELSEAAQEFYKAEGALTQASGMQLREQLQQAEDGLKAARAREHEIEIDAEAWKLLREKLKLAEDSEAAHLGRALGEPVGKRFAELTRHRYANLEFDPLLSAAGLQAAGVSVGGDVLSALSVGTRDQLATLVRLTIASQLKSAIILDDHLVQTDPVRLVWFRDMLLKTALETQVIVFTCRPSDYLRADELPEVTSCDFAGGAIRAVNLNGVVQRWEGARSRA